jgi:flavin reductase (DIM6/NTAB) family NADH-FMN oxidoreductase RutF
VGWISTVNLDGEVSLAPYSQFSNLGYDPPYVMFSAGTFLEKGRRTDSVRNATDTGEFVVNMATYKLIEAVNATASMVGPEIDEAALAGPEMIPSKLVRAPCVARSPIQLECRFHASLVLPSNTMGDAAHVVIGRVIGIHIYDEALTPDGEIDVLKIKPLARLGYFDYTTIESTFTLQPAGPHVEVTIDL